MPSAMEGLGAGVAVVAAAVAGLAVLSLGAVEQNEYGLMYNWVTKTIGSEVYHGGTHYIGFWNSFVRFPATVQTIEFSDRIQYRTAEALHTRTKEGLGLHLSISFQYKLTPENIPQLYELININYENLYMRIARDKLLEAASEYEGPMYWLEREAIGDHMRLLVDKQLRDTHASLWGLQLLIIDLPDRYEKSITLTQVQTQLMKTRHNEQLAAGIRADTEVMRASFNRDIQVVQADAQANFTLVTKLAEAEARKRKIVAEASALKYIRQKLKLSPIATVEYQELDAYAGLENATFLANLPGALPIVPLGGAAAGAATSFLNRPSAKRQSQPGQASLAAEEEDTGTLSSAAATAALTNTKISSGSSIAAAKTGAAPLAGKADAFLSFFGSA